MYIGMFMMCNYSGGGVCGIYVCVMCSLIPRLQSFQPTLGMIREPGDKLMLIVSFDGGIEPGPFMRKL